MSHLTEEQLSALADGALAPVARASAERHLEACAGCREALAGLVAQDRALASALGHNPGEDYFEEFAARVGGRLRAAGLKGAQARESGGRGLADWFRSPRKLALVGAVATVVAGAGIVMLSTREVRVVALREKEIESHMAQEAPAPQPAVTRPEAPPGVLPEPKSERMLAVEPAGPQPAGAPAGEGVAKTAARAGVESRAKAGLVSGEETATPAAGARAPANRAYEVRRNEAGEDVRVSKPGEFVYRPPRTAPVAAPAAPGEPVYAQKPQYATPLAAGKREGVLRGGARPAPTDAVTPAPSADQAVPEVAASAALAQESKTAAEREPGAGQTVAAQKELAPPGRILGLAERGAALQVRGTPEAFDGLPDGPRALARNARRLTAVSETIGLAPAWDSAAAAWERVIESVQGGSLESETRFQVARARFMAWQRSANGKRAARATQALDAFLEHAPRGAERDSAQAWLAELKR